MVQVTKKNRLRGGEIVRAISAVGIVIYHYSCSLSSYNTSKFLPLYKHANGQWGYIFVTVFFVLSGAMLYYNNPEIQSYKEFYLKRDYEKKSVKIISSNEL